MIRELFTPLGLLVKHVSCLFNLPFQTYSFVKPYKIQFELFTALEFCHARNGMFTLMNLNFESCAFHVSSYI